MFKKRKKLNRKNQRIITVTLNPSLDRTLITHYFHPGYHNNTTGTSRLDAAGAGLNISQALYSLGCNTHALVLLGNDATGKAYQVLLDDKSFPITAITTDGQTRSNTIIIDTGTGEETQITEEASIINQEDITLTANILKANITKYDQLVLAGDLPENAEVDTYAWLTKTANDLGAQVILACSGESLRMALPAKPHLIAISQDKLEPFFNIPIRDARDVMIFANKLREMGAENVLVWMMESNKTLLVAENDQWMVSIPETDEGTSSGVWSSFLAGFLAGNYSQKGLKDSVLLGASSALYTASHIGHQFGDLYEISTYLDQIAIETIEK